MKEKLRSSKFCAALVLSCAVLTSIFFWNSVRAGHWLEIENSRCPAASSGQDLSLRLGAARDIDQVFEILRRGDDSFDARCERAAFQARLAADDKFLWSVGLLTVSFFLFVGSLRSSRGWAYLLLGAGILIGAAFVASDFLENRQLARWIDAASSSAPTPQLAAPTPQLAAPTPQLAALKGFFNAKLTALALAGGALGLLWKTRCGKGWRRALWAMRAICLLSALALALAVGQGSLALAQWGLALLAGWFFLGTAHCVAIAVSPEPLAP